LEKVILIRFGEIFLKGNNRYVFENLLIRNIKEALEGIGCEVERSRARFWIKNFSDAEEVRVIERLIKVFGIHSISSALMVKTDIGAIFEASEKFIRQGTFKVITARADKGFELNSMQVSQKIGGMLLKKHPFLKVDVHKPDFTINIDIREGGYTFVFSDYVKGADGLPCGSAGKGLLLLSGGIDSPVAGYMLSRRGLKLDAIHFYSYPYTSELAKQKVITLCEKLSAYNGKTTLYVVPFTEIQEEIHKNCAQNYMITLMRRFMMRIAEKVAIKAGASALVNGENLGQVASQTMESIFVTNSAVSMPVFRPLIGFDKLDIIEIAQKIGTYETSILPYEDCCTVFLPQNPVIKPRLDFTLRQEAKLDVERLETAAISNMEVIVAKRP
jgi:thiamine biosynthesis protein ThiI